MKKIKNLLLALVLTFSAVFLIGCGGGPLDNEVSIDKASNYDQQMTASSMQTELSTAKDITTTNTGYKLSAVAKASNGSTKCIAIVKINDGKLVEVATKINVNYTYDKVTVKADIEAYLKDSCWYISGSTQNAATSLNFKYKYTLDQEEAFEEYLDTFDDTFEAFEVDSLLEAVEEITGTFDSSKFSYAKTTEGTLSQYRIKIDDPITTTYMGMEGTLHRFAAYMNVDDGTLVAAEISTKSTVKMASEEITSEERMGIEQYNGEISYPNFSSYEEPAL